MNDGNPSITETTDIPNKCGQRPRRLHRTVFVAVFTLTFAVGIGYTFSRPKIYQAEACVVNFQLTSLMGDPPKPMVPGFIYENMAARMAMGSSDLPGSAYATTVLNNRTSLIEAIRKNTSFVVYPEAHKIGFRYHHAEPMWAERTANVWADECIAQNARLQIKRATDLAETIKSQEVRIHTALGKQQPPVSSLQSSLSQESQQAATIDIKAQEASLAKMKEELLIILERTTQSARLIDYAITPESYDPSASNIPQYLGLSFAASVVAGLGAALITKRAITG